MHTRRIAGIVAVVTIAASACAGTRETHGSAAPTGDLNAVPVSTSTQQTLSAAERAFAIDLLRTAPSNRNLVLSPLSVATALQMAYVGARGTTATEMARTLHLPSQSAATIAAAAARLLRNTRADAGKGALDVSDDTWVQIGHPLERSFVIAMSSGFHATPHQTDFIRHPEPSRRAINDTVARETHDRIRELMPEGSLDSSTRLVLTNAIYLRQRWDQPFDPATPAAFRPQPSQAEQVPTMHLLAPLRYAEAPTWRAVEIPYAGGKLAMDVVLPREGMSPRASATAAAAALAQVRVARPVPVDLSLPKFKFSWHADLVGLLQSLGMHAAFADADFSGISRRDALAINVVQHQAMVAVDEQGTEAAAATGVAMAVSGLLVPGHVTQFAADRPFVFAVVDRAADLPMFVGRVNDPSLG